MKTKPRKTPQPKLDAAALIRANRKLLLEVEQLKEERNHLAIKLLEPQKREPQPSVGALIARYCLKCRRQLVNFAVGPGTAIYPTMGAAASPCCGSRTFMVVWPAVEGTRYYVPTALNVDALHAVDHREPTPGVTAPDAPDME